MSLALDLPFDRHRAPNTRRAPVGYSFDCVLTLENDAEAALIAAFAIVLARHTDQRAIPLETARVTAGGSVERRFTILPTTPDTTYREVRRKACEALLSQEREGELDDSGRDGADEVGARASVVWLAGDRALELDAERAIAWGAAAGPSDLTLVAGPIRGRHRAALVYDASLFELERIERLTGHLCNVLGSAATDLDTRIAALPLLTPEERRWIESVCEGAAAREREPVHVAFERHAAASPDTVALRWRDHAMSYAELNSRSNRLARALIARGAGPETAVAVCVEPSFDIAVALLAILKAQAVYVPLDPSYPTARLRTILADSKPVLLLTQSSLSGRLQLEALERIEIDALDFGERSAENLELACDPERTASVYYTSGTTGTPKGVMASQANLAHYVGVARERYAIGPGDTLPAIARFSFSISMFELAMPLVAGATSIVLDRDHVLDPARLARTLASVSVFHAGPSLLKALVAYVRRHGDPAAFARVRHASSGGDMVPPELLEALKEIFQNAEIFVIYGASELSCMGCTYPVPRDRQLTRTYVGRPFEGVAVRVLDAALNVVPVGTSGEVCFAGSGIVKGYLDRPDLDKEKFVLLDGRRFYRTGDIGRLSSDGFLELLGRHDFQTKIRGMRVELAEVEHHLRRAPHVREAVAMARDGADGENVLVGYVVTDQDAESDRAARIAAIRRYLTEQLPDYMVPAAYVELDRLPLNHNLKVDRRALPPPERSLIHSASTRVRPPETATEQTLAELFRRLLGVDDVGLDDNFFELGGHSLLGVRLVLELETALGVTLDGMDVLRESLAVLATTCDAERGIPRSTAPQREALTVEASPPEVFHFGQNSELYGVLHGLEARSGDAVLICAPVGQEHVRGRFVLQRLGEKLAARGVPALRFDYFGCGDSLGDGGGASIRRWQEDIAAAHAELVRRTGARAVVAVGVRLGALLLFHAARRFPLTRVVVWDPVSDGNQHCAALRAVHQAYVRSVGHLRWRRQAGTDGIEELLGTSYTEESIRELEALSLGKIAPELDLPVRWLESTTSAADKTPLEGRANFRSEYVDLDCGWHDVASLDDILPDAGVSRALARLVGDP
ncbi:MAG TPA: amino acid adenylation domain-containing protein [Polyangiaceae bacterium]|nr:amino acid adenylation domain-containing protein [Polyangiaceae bacterium]